MTLAGIAIPSGKVEIGLASDRGNRVALWGKHTEIGIDRDEKGYDWQPASKETVKTFERRVCVNTYKLAKTK